MNTSKSVAPDRLVDLEELRRLAEAATPWDQTTHMEKAAWEDAANPATILSLLDQLAFVTHRHAETVEDLSRAEQRVAALEEGLRRSAERFHGLVDEGHEFHTFQECPLESCEAARSLLQSSAASQGDEE